MKTFIVSLFLLQALALTIPSVVAAGEQKSGKAFECLPWKVGQFVEYQIVHLENEGTKNRYRISLVGEEKIGEKPYFWEKIDIFENVYYIKGELFRKNITLLALVEPLTSEKFSQDAARYIQNGFCPSKALKLKIQLSDGPFIEVNPASYFSHQGIIEETPYSFTPDAAGKIDFSRIKFSSGLEKINFAAGVLECEHIFVKTDRQKNYFDEGFDLWRSSKVPLLGIVKLKFSETLYWDKWAYRNETKQIKSIKGLIRYFFKKRVPGRRRPDTYTIKLISYGQIDLK